MRKRLKRAAGDLEIAKDVDPWSLALQKVAELELDHSAVTEETLHRFRIAGKRARYIAEMAGKNAEAIRLVEQLKHMQDVIGDWHDWAQLAQGAEKLFGGVQDSALVAALRNVTRAKFRQAVHTLTETQASSDSEKAGFGNDYGPPPRGRVPGRSCSSLALVSIFLPEGWSRPA